jgi:hypothetical protein
VQGSPFDQDRDLGQRLIQGPVLLEDLLDVFQPGQRPAAVAVGAMAVEEAVSDPDRSQGHEPEKDIPTQGLGTVTDRGRQGDLDQAFQLYHVFLRA